jgi:hypothetical protein
MRRRVLHLRHSWARRLRLRPATPHEKTTIVIISLYVSIYTHDSRFWPLAVALDGVIGLMLLISVRGLHLMQYVVSTMKFHKFQFTVTLQLHTKTLLSTLYICEPLTCIPQTSILLADIAKPQHIIRIYLDHHFFSPLY